ncbi:DUF4352 domain-containing protein [Cyanobacteria bacterium FACHB-472]|nr:DUF4352 domain-containing protein [Cyanobacteria bacterium FACHB-472]
MAGFRDKMKSMVNLVQHKVTEIQNDEKIKEVVQKAHEKIAEIQNDEKVKELVNQAQEYQKSAQHKVAEYQSNKEKNKLEKAENYIKENKFQEAINILLKIKNDSEYHEEAQQKIHEYLEASAVYVLQNAIENYNKGYSNEAIKSLKTITEERQVYQQAQEKIQEFEEAIKQKIAGYPNLVPIVYNDKLVAATLLDETTYLVVSLERKEFFYSSLGSTYADGVFLIVCLIVRNDSKKTRTISASAMTIIDKEGREFSSSSSGSTALTLSGDKTSELISTEIQPGLQKRISIVFDIPPEALDLKLKIPRGGFGKPAILPLALAL